VLYHVGSYAQIPPGCTPLGCSLHCSGARWPTLPLPRQRLRRLGAGRGRWPVGPLPAGPPPRGGPGVPRKRWYWVISAPFHRQHPPVGHCGAAASTAGRPGALQIQNLRPDHDPWGVQARSSTTSAFVLWLCFVICVVIYHQGPRACCSSYGCCMSGEIPTHSTIYLTDEMNLLFGRSG
jgi:hypothetical protein